MDNSRSGDVTDRSILPFPSSAVGARIEHLNAQSHHALLVSVLNNMSQGVLMFDAEARMVFCNRRYTEMYGLSAETASRGSSLHELLNHQKAVGAFPEDIDGYVANLLADIAQGKTASGIAKSANGRAFSFMHKPIAGEGWITTYEDVTDRQRAEERMIHMARHDALTDLPNRTMLRERLEYELKRVKRGECLAVLCLDLDHFKAINDTLGHPVGDELLKVVAERLRRCTREPDTVARLGGDEFAIIMTGMFDPSDAAALAKRIRDSITKPYDLDGHQILADISIGISLSPIDGTEPDLLLKNADMALYGAKGDGRGVYRYFEPEMDARMKARREVDMGLRAALVNGEFELHYQPLVNLRDNQITAFEALLRWNHPRRGLLPPGEFIPVAEETGLIIPIGEWALRRACREAAKWPSNIKVAVNLSVAQLKSRKLVDVVGDALSTSGVPADRLQLEITETLLMQDTFNSLATLRKLRALGVQIALDDFGTGYSSLSYLRSFPFDKIKIDRSFIQDLSRGAETRAIVHAVADLAKSLNMISTAEGVETKQQFETLKALGCVEMQGYLFCRPGPAAEVVQMLLEGSALATGS